ILSYPTYIQSALIPLYQGHTRNSCDICTDEKITERETGHMQYIEKDSNTNKRLLSQFLTSKHTSHLEEAKAMSVSVVRRNIYPEEIVRSHMKALESLCGEAFDDYKKSRKFLLEALIAYRRAQSEFESLRMEQIELKTEIQVAANMQKTLLSTEIPHIEGIDIGAISVPLHQMNGDYY